MNDQPSCDARANAAPSPANLNATAQAPAASASSSAPPPPPPPAMGEVIRIDQSVVQEHLSQLVTRTVEETLNGLLEAEADQLCGAKRYEHNPDRLDTRAGHYASCIRKPAQ